VICHVIDLETGLPTHDNVKDRHSAMEMASQMERARFRERSSPPRSPASTGLPSDPLLARKRRSVRLDGAKKHRAEAAQQEGDAA